MRARGQVLEKRTVNRTDQPVIEPKDSCSCQGKFISINDFPASKVHKLEIRTSDYFPQRFPGLQGKERVFIYIRNDVRRLTAPKLLKQPGNGILTRESVIPSIHHDWTDNGVGTSRFNHQFLTLQL